jgi:DNA repair exonuclease SbcCD ATPase subunit
LSYESASVCLNNPGYIFVRGDNNNPEDSAKSNGCGKSTLFNAIVWALTGQTTSGIKDVANIYTNGVTSSEVEFDCNGHSYLIKRTKNPSNLKIYIDNEDKSGKGIRDSEKLLTEYLPEITNSLINSVIILGQGLPQRFTNNTPSGRKEVLETLSKSDFMIEDIKQRLSTRRDYLNTSLRQNEDKKLRNETTINALKSNLETTNNKLVNLATSNTLEEYSDALKNELTELEARKISINDYLNKYQSNVDELNEHLIFLDTKRDQELDSIELEDTLPIEQLIFETRSEISSKLNEIRKLDSVTDTCPTCGQKLPNVYKIDTTDLKNEVVTLEQKLEEYKKELTKLQTNNEVLIHEVKLRHAELKSTLSHDLVQNKNLLNNCKNDLTICEKKITNKTIELSNTENQIKMLEHTRDELKAEQIRLSDEIDYLIDDNVVIQNDIDSIKEHIDINNKMNTIVKRDFRGYLLTNVIDFISNKCKNYSTQVFGTPNLTFTLDGNNISIAYDGKEYESLSGGEKQKVDVILQLAIRDMLCSYLNFSSNILVLDEITDSLDSVGAQKVFNLISSNLSDVETIYIISHHTDFSIPYDGEIHIVKGDDKISRII